jgi:hypothetical protein
LATSSPTRFSTTLTDVTRDYGKTQKDIIYKINFQKAFAFVRFLWHVDSGNWQLVHLGYKTEGGLPFPHGWEHIYPR